MSISLIAAVSENNVIGKDNKTPWHLPGDLRHFVEKTKGHHVIMGRRTYENLRGSLSDRINIVLTRQEDLKAEGFFVVHSLKEALEMAKDDSEIFVIGGAEIFKEAMPLADKIYLTRVHATIDGDKFFPEIDEKEWKILEREDFKADGKNEYDYSFITFCHSREANVRRGEGGNPEELQ